MRIQTDAGQVIPKLLAERGRSLEWLAEATEIPAETLTKPLSLLHAAMVAEVLGIDLPVLTTGNRAESPLTVAELARELKVSTDTVYRKAGKEIPAFKIAGSWRFYLSEVVAAGRPEKVDAWAQPARAKRRAS